MRISAIVFIPLLAYCTAAAGQSFVDVPLWPGPGAKKDPRVLSINDGACGPVALARVTKLPSPRSQAPLQSELVVELSESGTVIRRWPKPVDYDVAGVAGTQLLVSPYGNESTGMFVTAAGDITVTTPPLDRPSATAYECPRIPAFGKSAYLRCYEIKDIKSNSTRRLAYEGPCT